MKKILKVVFVLFIFCEFLFAQENFPKNGISENFKPTYAFKNANIIISPNEQIKNGVLIIKDDIIINVDSNLEIPENAITFDLQGDYIYPSFIDLFSDYGLSKVERKNTGYAPQYESNKKGAYSWNQAIHPEIHASQQFFHDRKKMKGYHEMGYGALLTHVSDGIFRGSGCFVVLADNKENEDIILEKAATFYSFNKGTSNQRYPTSLMGSIALIKQTLLDSEWHENSNENTNISLTEYNRYKNLPKIFDVNSYLDYSRLFKISDEFEIDYIAKGNGYEFLRIEEIKQTNFPIIVPINFPEDYDVTNLDEALAIKLSDLKKWETAPFNPRILAENSIPFSITSYGSKNKTHFLKNLKLAVSKGLKKSDALKALTTTPAKLIGIDEKIGKIEKGKIANFLICSSDIFDDGIIYENWTLGSRNVLKEKVKNDIRGFYTFKSEKFNNTSAEISGKKENPSIKILAIDSSNLITSFKGNQLTLNDKDGEFKAQGIYKNGNIAGEFLDDSGKIYQFLMIRDSVAKEKTKSKIVKKISKIPTVWTPNKSKGFENPIKSKSILFKNATLWTNEEIGIIKSADIAISNGKIIAIGEDLDTNQIPNIENINLEIINAKGKHITSGIIDEHSHIAISRGVNESSQAITAEVSIADVINPDDQNIYRQLACGVTCSQLLHGSANPIGGQSALIKLRWGKTAEEMKIKNCDGFIKFALGENVKQSNWGDFNTTRYPQTRMGVEQVFYDAFYRAKKYKKEWSNYNSLSLRKKRETNPPREDIELNALVEILDGKRHITCHSYVESEINMLMHVADSMGFKINTFTHILEGYKLADKLKNHGAGASTFSDWWAYKFEVNDAIPYNATILNNAGVITAINSDDAEMGRRLNQEAAKAVKYGGTTQEDAWKMVTLNPAKLLRLDDRMGSLKVGKDADIVVWTKNPLSIYTQVEQTYIDGSCYYDINENIKTQDRDYKEKLRIIKILSTSKSKNKIKNKPEKESFYHCDTIEEHEHGHDHEH